MTTSAAIDLGAARRHANETVKKSGTSFAAGMAILPKKRREAMHAIYAFCREVDDIADGDLPADEKRRRLAEWRSEIERLCAGAPQFPIGVALAQPVRDFGLPKPEFLLLIEGMEMDAEGPIVAPSMEQLFAYTRRVAGAVGRLSMPVFGAPEGEASDRFALALGDALQLTNILRDVAEDARIGRLYLPAELLDRYGVAKDPARVAGSPLPLGEGSGVRVPISPSVDRTSDGILFPDPSPKRGGENRSAIAAVARDLAEIATQKFAAARAALGALDWRTVRPALAMMGVYEAYLKKLERRGWDRLGEPLTMSRAEKLLISARFALAPPRLPPSPPGAGEKLGT